MAGIGNALSSYTAQNIGAHKEERVVWGYRVANGMVLVCAAVICLVLQLFNRPTVSYTHLHSAGADGYAIFNRKPLPDFIRAEPFAGFGVQFQNCRTDFLVFQRTRSRSMMKMLVIGTAVDTKDAAEDIDVMFKPQGMNSIQSLFECGVNMAIAFFNIKFSSSRMALRF